MEFGTRRLGRRKKRNVSEKSGGCIQTLKERKEGSLAKAVTPNKLKSPGDASL